VPQRPLSAHLARARGWRPSPVALRRTFLVALVANAGIVVTGGAVRLTASGLGCPTVPRCTDTSMVTTREMGLHGLIEFTNRQLTFVLTATVVAALVTAWRAGRGDLTRLGGALFAGIVAQAVLGAVTVLTGLNPVTVMAHFLLSMVLVAVAAYAHEVARGPRTATTLVVRREVRAGARLLSAVTALVLVLGTVVTGTGPHSGDKTASDRLPFDLEAVTQLHADLVFLLVGLSVGLLLAVRATGAPGAVVRRSGLLVCLVLGQGVVGYVQYATDLPVLLVGAHVLGATLVWIAALRLLLGCCARVRPSGSSAPRVASASELVVPA
jgi:cytochrome c oxidase assembly protein subunit 15